MRNLGRGALPCFRGPPPRRPPTQGALPSGAGGSSPTHGRQQAGPGRVGLRSAGFRGRQATGFEAKGILKDHGSLSRSLVTFCRRRKSLARRRNIYSHPPPNFGIGGSAPYAPRRRARWSRPTCCGFAGACPVSDPPTAERKSPLEKGAVSGADWGFLPQMQHRREKPPGIAFGHASPLFKGGGQFIYTHPPPNFGIGGSAPYDPRRAATRGRPYGKSGTSQHRKFLIPNS